MTSSDAPASTRLPERVLVLVRGLRDGELTRELLARAGMEGVLCSSVAELCAKIEEGGAVALLAEEVLTAESIGLLAAALKRQPPWSDFPIVIFSAGGARTRPEDDDARVLGNVTFLDRPVRIRTMLASVRAAIRSRRRQYEGRRAIESRDVFLAMLGHELRNPLGAIRLAIAVADTKLRDGVRPKEHGIIDRQARHLTRLVDDLLDIARITHGKVVLTRERLNLVEVVRSAFEVLDVRAREHDLSFGLRAPKGEVWVDGDRQRLEQVFANLLTNAIKYTPRGGDITVSVRAEAGEASVDVADTGVGIAAEMLDRVFDAFAQADRSLDRTEGGMGLGLAVVRSVVQLHGGTVEAASRGAGRGSTFVVRLPTVAEVVIPTSTRPNDAAEHPSAKRVVVVEDSSDIRELLAELLQREGHEVACAADGPHGLERILTLSPDIAFIDLGLPGFDGLEVARRARASGSRARLVAVTGYGQPDDRRHATDAGFDDHLTKPVIEADLERAMLRLERRGATDGASAASGGG